MIFVSIASYCDPYLIHTVRDACAKAKSPGHLVFGIIDQNPSYQRDEVKSAANGAKVRYCHIDPIESRGTCWARSLAFSLYEGEDYLLQIDSHMLFEPGWDEQLVEQLRVLRGQSAKPIISVYPMPFEFDDNDQPVVTIKPSETTTLVLRPKPEERLSEESATLGFRAEHVFKREPIRGCHIAGGFLFTLGSFVDEIPYDPHLYFTGEEQTLAVRAYTHGWDIYHPHQISLYHLYKQPDRPHTSHHWHAEWEQKRDFKYAELTAKARERVKDLVYRRRDLGVFGLGKERSLRDYARLSGIDYDSRQITQPYQSEYGSAPVAVMAASIEDDQRARIGAFMPTHGRPDLALAALLQLAMQSRIPNVVAVFQNGDAVSYESLVCGDRDWPFRIEWIFSPDKLKQHEWYRRPLQHLIDAGCDQFLWIDHDDLYHANHVAQCEEDLATHDFRISLYAHVLYIDQGRYKLRERVRFTSHAPGGMCTSMAFNRKFALALAQDLSLDRQHHYANQVVAQVTMPRFDCHLSDQLSTTYVAHRGAVTSAKWVDAALDEKAL